MKLQLSEKRIEQIVEVEFAEGFPRHTIEAVKGSRGYYWIIHDEHGDEVASSDVENQPPESFQTAEQAKTAAMKWAARHGISTWIKS